MDGYVAVIERRLAQLADAIRSEGLIATIRRQIEEG